MTEPIYVVGHRNPDTDSIVSAMAYAALNNALGDNRYIPARQGPLNDETAFLLDRFGFGQPQLLTTVRTQVSDIDFDHPPCLNKDVPMIQAWSLFRKDKSINSIPVLDDDGRLYGLLTVGSIAENDMASVEDPTITDVPVYNLLTAIEGRIVNSEDDVFNTISGTVTVVLPGMGLGTIRENSIVFCGEQEDAIDRAIEVGASCVVVCRCGIADKYRGISSRTCIIVSPKDPYRAARQMFHAIPVNRVCQNAAMESFYEDDFLDDVSEAVLKSRYRAYPVMDKDEKVIGTLGRFHLMRPRRKKVVLVDHNEKSQSVPGLDQADIVAIIDHHRLADVQTGYPCFMRNEPVGSTTTIVAAMYQERGLIPSPAMAGLMCAAILSDTVMFKSPTCTALDHKIAERLADRAGIDIDELGREIFSVGANASKPMDELLNTDFKEFHIGGHVLGICQITTLDSDKLLNRLDEMVTAMDEKRKTSGYDMMLLMLTNVLLEGTELVFTGDAQIIQDAFNCEVEEDNHVFLPHIMSRKKQVVPAMALLWG